MLYDVYIFYNVRDLIMKHGKSLLLMLGMVFSTIQVQSSQDVSANLIISLLANPSVQQMLAPVATALAAGIAKQILDINNGQNKTLNPLVLEIRDATEHYGPSIAAGFQAAGGSIHVKVPNEINLDNARAGFAPFIYFDCAPGSDKALLDRTDADKQTVISLRVGLGQNCKVEARCNLSNAVWAGCSVAALVVAQVAIALVQPQA